MNDDDTPAWLKRTEYFNEYSFRPCEVVCSVVANYDIEGPIVVR